MLFVSVVELFTLEFCEGVYKTKRNLQDSYKETGQAKHTKEVKKVAIA